MAIKITRYKVSCWLDKKKCEPIYGVKVYVPGTGWADVAENGKPVLRKTERQAKAYIERMKKKRDRSGYRLAKAA